MNLAPTFTCKYCGNVLVGNMSGSPGQDGVHTGFLPMCTCPDARKEWETAHRASIEQRKARRRLDVRSGGVVASGRLGESRPRKARRDRG